MHVRGVSSQFSTALLLLCVALGQRLLTTLITFAVIGPEKLIYSLMAYDAGWYEQIAVQGYDADDTAGHSNLAFFPLYPMAARALSWLPGVSVSAALLGLAFIGSLIATLPIYAVGKHLHSAEVGWLLALLWGAVPQSVVLIMGYPESWFTAATALGLLAVLKQRPLAAASAAFVAGLLRPSAVPLIIVVMMWSLWQARKGRVARHAAAAILAPLGMGLYVVFVALRTGRLTGYVDVQGQWNLRMAWPWEFLSQIDHQLHTSTQHQISLDLFIPIVLGYVALLILLAGRWHTKDYRWIIVYTALSASLIVSRASYFWSEPRQFLPLFPLLLPLATIKSSRWAWVLLIAAATAASAWLSAAVLLARQYSI